MAIYPVFAKIVMDCDRMLTKQGFPGCLEVIAPKKKAEEKSDDTTRPQAFQTGVFVLEVALARLFMSWGVAPTVVVGHR